MIAIENTIVSEDLLEVKFVCDLKACKGACCVEGDSGAPLDVEETSILDDIYEDVKPYMAEDGIRAIEKQGKYVLDYDSEFVTPLVEGKHCAYVYFEGDTAKCAIEKAYLEGKVDFKKPVSCHLYPVRISKYKGFEAVNYHQWNICKPACSCGGKLGVKVYQFLKEPLTRKFGKEWYEQLKLFDESRETKNK